MDRYISIVIYERYSKWVLNKLEAEAIKFLISKSWLKYGIRRVNDEHDTFISGTTPQHRIIISVLQYTDWRAPISYKLYGCKAHWQDQSIPLFIYTSQCLCQLGQCDHIMKLDTRKFK